MLPCRLRTLIAVVTLAAGSWSAAGARQPNVILLMPDQMRGQAMGIAGNPQVRTPHVDRLAGGGIYLPNTFANNPVCCPARATIMTGVYPHQHGVIVNDLRLREDRVTLAEILAEAGYATGFVGKWHLDGGHRMPGFVPPGPRRQGFEFWAANECNHQHFDSVYFRDTPEPLPITTFETEVWMDESLRFVRANKDRPFFLWYACGPPHNPYAAPPEYESRYPAAEILVRKNWQDGVPFGSRQDIARYYAMITAIDDQVGRLMAELDRLGLTEDTLVLFTSDHGDMLGSQGLRFKSKPFIESICVPGIIHYPRRIQPGQRSEMLFSHVDILPTLLTFCGVTIPGPHHGRDLSAALTRGKAEEQPAGERDSARAEADADVLDREKVFFQLYEPRHSTGVPAGWRGVCTERYTYARLRDRPWVLYDRARDPYELTNRVDDPSHEALRRRLDGYVQAEMARTGDRWELDLTDHEIFHRGPARYRPGGKPVDEAPPESEPGVGG